MEIAYETSPISARSGVSECDRILSNHASVRLQNADVPGWINDMKVDGLRHKAPKVPSVSLRKALLQFAFWMVGINPFYSYAQEAVSPIPPCDPGLQASATISFADTSSVPLLVKPDSKDGQLIASSHIYARNDTGSSLNEWCAKGYFSNYLDRSENVLLSLNGSPQKDGTACVNSQVNAGTIKDFVLSFPTIRDDLPLIGLVTFQASGIIERPSTSTVSKRKSSSGRNDAAPPKALGPCTVPSKEISRGVVIPSSQSVSRASELIMVTGSFGGLFFIFCLWRFRARLMAPMGSSQWTFSSSTTTNLTIFGSLLGAALVSSCMPDYPHQMSKQSFIVLGLIFAVLAGLSPILYNFCCRPTGPNAANPQNLDFEGWVWLFLLADGLTIWAVCGQLATLGLLFDEFAKRQFVSNVGVDSAWLIAIAVCIALLIYCYRTARFYVEEHPARMATTVSLGEEAVQTGTRKSPGPRWSAL